MLDLINRAVNKLLIYASRLLNFFFLRTYKYPLVLASHESLKSILEHSLSVVRFGDGELNVIRGIGWGFQEYDFALSNRLKEVLNSNESNIAVCIPDVFKDRSRFTVSARRFWYDQVLNYLNYWNKYTIKGKIYYDALFTRFYMDLSDKDIFPNRSLELLKMIWDNSNLLIIEGAGSRLGYKNDLFNNAISVKRIICPAENAYSKYEKILAVSKMHAKDRLVLIALGMTATILAFDLARNGIRAIDIGHVDIEYEWYRMGTLKKVPVKYRYMNEVSCRQFERIEDKDYTTQIIAEIC